MDIALLFSFLLMVAATSPYKDYPASRMPDYGIDYDNPELTPSPDEFVDRSPQARTSFDYKYDDESDSHKPIRDVDVDNRVLNKNKRFSPKSTPEDIDEDIYNNQDEILPRKMSRSKTRKPHRRKKVKYDSGGDDKNIISSRNHNVEDNIDDEDYRIREGDDRENYDKEAERFNRREIINRQARRKPRDRPINLILPDREYLKDDNEDNVVKKTKKAQERHFNKQDLPNSLLEYEFDDMKRINSLKDSLPVSMRRTKVNLPESPSTSQIQEWPNRRANNPDDIPLKSSIISKKPTPTKTISNTPRLELAPLNKSEVSLAERSRLSILRKVQKKENLNVTLTTKPPVLMQVTNHMQTVVLVESHSEKDLPNARRVLDDSSERVDRAKKLMRYKLVADAKNIRDLTDNWDEMICDYIDEESTTLSGYIAAELEALLGHRQRKDIPEKYLNPSSHLPTTFPPQAVDIQIDKEWNRFIKLNRTSQLNCSIYLILLTLLNYLQYFT